MGNNTSQKTNDNLMKINVDTEIKGDINIYICGNINTFLDCDKEGQFNYIASRNYYVLEKVFEKNIIQKLEIYK